MKTYTIKTGKTDWTPKEPLEIFCDFKAITWEFSPDKTMAFPYAYEGGIDQDWRDWKKIGGISLAAWGLDLINLVQLSRDSIQLGWRYNVELQVFEYAAYVNENGAHYAFERADQVLRCGPGAKGGMRLTKLDRQNYRAALYFLEEGPKAVNEFPIRTRKEFTIYRRTGLWYGGRNNAPGPYGGRAPRNMRTQVGYNRV